MFENNVVYKFVQDLNFFVIGGDYENKLILATVLQAFTLLFCGAPAQVVVLN